MDTYLFRVTMRGQLLIKIIDDMASAGNGILKLTPHDFRINAEDDAQHCMLQTTLFRHAFVNFYLSPDQSDVQYDIDLRKLKDITSSKIFKSDNNKQKGQKSFSEENRPTISFYVKKQEPENLYVCHAFMEAEYTNTMFVKRSDVIRNFEGDYGSDCSWTFCSERIHRFFRALKHDNNKYCTIEINQDTIQFKGEPERRTSLVVSRKNNILVKDDKIKNTSDADHLDGKKSTIPNKKGRPRRDAIKVQPIEQVVTEPTPQPLLIVAEEPTPPSTTTVIENNFVPITGCFVLEYLKTFTRAKNLNHEVNMYLDNAKPLLFEYLILTENADVKQDSLQCVTCQQNEMNLYKDDPKNTMIGVSRYFIKPGGISDIQHRQF